FPTRRSSDLGGFCFLEGKYKYFLFCNPANDDIIVFVNLCASQSVLPEAKSRRRLLQQVGIMNKNRIKLQGQLKKYMSWPIILTSLLVVMNIAVYFASRKAGAIVTMFVAIYIAIVVLLYYHNRPLVLNELISFAVQYGQVQKNLMREFLIPYALLDAQGRFMWTNDKFTELTGKDKKYRKSVTTIFPEVTLEKLPKGEKVTDIHTVYNERNYRCSLKQLPIRELFQNTELLDSEVEDDSTLYTLYVFDETEINEYIRKYEDEIMVTGLLYLDNYEEAMESVEDV